MAVGENSQQRLGNEDKELIASLESEGAPKIAVLNKCDLESAEISLPEGLFECEIRMSAKEGTGLELLKNAVEKLFIDEKIDTAADAIVTNAREFAALTEAIELITDAVQAAKMLGADTAASDLERAIAVICELDGKAVSENVVSDIFSRFCVGK